MQLQFTREELLSEHDIVSSQFESGRAVSYTHLTLPTIYSV